MHRSSATLRGHPVSASLWLSLSYLQTFRDEAVESGLWTLDGFHVFVQVQFCLFGRHLIFQKVTLFLVFKFST